MSSLLRWLNIAVMALSVISASIFAAHIPPLWLPFTVSVLILAGSLYLRRSHTRQVLQQTNSGRHPVIAFQALAHKAFHTAHNMVQQQQWQADDAERLEDLTELLTTELDRIHAGLIEALGIKAFIEIILPYARGERLLNRALSALTDHYPEEARQSLTDSLPFLKETLDKLEALSQEIKTENPTHPPQVESL